MRALTQYFVSSAGRKLVMVREPLEFENTLTLCLRPKMKMLPQELEKSDLQVRQAFKAQDDAFKRALMDAVARGLEHVPICPEEIAA